MMFLEVFLGVLNILVTPVTEIVKGSIAPLRHQIGYVVHCGKYIDELEKTLVELEIMRDDVKGSVEAAERGGQVIKNVVRLWLTKVDTIEKEVKGLVQAAQIRGLVVIKTEEEEEQLLRRVDTVEIEATQLNVETKNIDGCFKGGWCDRHTLGKEAKIKIGVVDKLLNERNFDNVSDPPLTPSMESMYSEDFEEFESTKVAMKKVMDALKDERINIVGVYGMGGVGKTTLMKEVAKQVKNDKLFDEVVMATVSQNPDLKSIQGEIAEKLGLPLLEKSKSLRAGRLSESLKLDKRNLIILDDLWARLDLGTVGIPDRKSCKIVLTTRSQEVCSAMKTQEIILVEVLSEQDSWHLFQENVGDVVNARALHKVAWEVVKECGGLPIALVTLGRALRDKDNKIVLWKDVATKLKNSIPKDIVGMESEVFNSIKLSYDFLESEETKKCFLFCCLFPEEDHQISMNDDGLMMYVIGEALLEDVDNLEEARVRLHAVIDKLIASCLLLKSDCYEGIVRMHDIVRDVAIYIAKEDINGFIVKARTGLTQWPQDREKLGKCMRMSLMNNNIAKLPSRPECSQLLTLSLRKNGSLKEIPDSFFESMKSLLNLDLSYTSISALPPSLSCLVNLRTLCLENCEFLTDVSLIGKLKNLEILNLCGTNIQRLSKEIGGLTNLKLLNLTETWHLEIIPPNSISSLSRLEELYMGKSFRWQSDRIGDGSNASFSEVAFLTCLTTLFLSKEIPNFLKNLTKFEITVGDHYMTYGTPWILKCMRLDFRSDPIQNWVKVLLQRIDKLELVECKGSNNVLQLDTKGFNNLKSLDVGECQMECLMTVVEEFPEMAFSSLENLELRNMESLKAICHGPLPARSLNKVTTLRLSMCDKLIIILPSNLLRRLENLEELDVYACCELEEVFNSEGLEEGHATISRLREISLEDLPNLMTIWKGFIPLVSFQNLKVMSVKDCNRLRFLFSPTMAQRLQQLEWLKIRHCEEMVKIISEVEDDLQTTTSSTNTRLRQTNSNTWPSLPPPPIFPNLRQLFISNCHSLKHLFPMRLVRCLQQLEELFVSKCDQMEEIIVDEEEDEEARENDRAVLPRLKILQLESSKNLSSFFQRKLLLDWPSLQTMHVRHCLNLKKLPLGPQSAPKLREVIGVDAKWLEGLEWEDESIKSRIQLVLKNKK